MQLYVAAVCDAPPSLTCTLIVQVTCFFIDTANNILEYVRLLNYLLKPGGSWINFGPLLYHYSEMDHELSVELSYEELRATFEPLGFKLVKEQVQIAAIALPYCDRAVL
jgi:hypothetical protein